MKKSNYSLLLMAACLLIGHIAATQFVAYALSYQAALGPGLCDMQGHKVYVPFAYWLWYLKFHNEAPKLFGAGLNFILLSVIGFIACFLLYRRMTAKPILDSHGTARWATIAEIEKTNLLDGKGIILGKLPDGRYLRDNDKTHALVIAPTRSGKGVGIIIPTLFTWPGSVVVTDIKGENWEITSRYRKDSLKNVVLSFNPISINSCHYNPFDEIRLRTSDEVKDLANLMNILIDPAGTGEIDHWHTQAGNLISLVMLHLKYVMPQPSFADILKFLFNPDKALPDALKEAMTYEHDPTNTIFKQIYGTEGMTHPIVAQKAASMLAKAEKEFASIVSTAEAILAVYADPLLAANTATSDFLVSDLMNYEKPVSLYLIGPPSDLDRLNPVFRMIVELIYRRLTEKMEFKDGQQADTYRHRLLMLLDEFPALGRLDTFERALAYIAGYGIKSLLICQGKNQLTKTYTANNSIIDNCHVRLVHTPNDAETPKYISEMLGKKTILTKSKNYTDSLFGSLFGAKSFTVQATGRELLRPEEVAAMPRTDEILFVAGQPPIQCKKVKWFEDENFKPRAAQSPPTDRIRAPITDSSLKEEQKPPEPEPDEEDPFS